MNSLKKSTTFTSREFNQDTAGAKREAADGPVFITDRGQPSHVLLSHAQYQRLTQAEPSVAAMFADPDSADVELPLPKRAIQPMRELDFN